MDDVKKTYREGEQQTKEAWREADGEVSVADHVGNVGDELNKQAGNLGDDVDTTADRASDSGKEAWRKADGDESLADKIGNAGDDMRRTVDDNS
jgi:hypothetical protein